jgi:uncharacterized membrane protein YsdA (DUF1294 family)
MARYHPTQLFLGLGLTLALALSLALWQLGLPAAYAYLGGVNIATLVFYAYDKQRARAGGMRVPEAVLHGAVLVGGMLGAITGQLLLRHKTRKRSFQMVFLAIVVLQIAVGAAYWRYVRN